MNLKINTILTFQGFRLEGSQGGYGGIPRGNQGVSLRAFWVASWVPWGAMGDLLPPLGSFWAGPLRSLVGLLAAWGVLWALLGCFWGALVVSGGFLGVIKLRLSGV